MASEDAANSGAQPAAPTVRKKSRKKKKEKPGAGEGARREAVGQMDEIAGLTRAGCRALALGDTQEAVGRFREALLLSGSTASPRLRRACAFNLGAAYVESGEPEKGLEFLLQSQPAEGESGARSRDLYFSIGAAREGLQDFPKALEHFGRAIGPDRAAQAGSRAGTRVQMGCCYLGMREPARAARCFLDAARTYEEAASPEAAAVALSRASGSMLQSRQFRAAEIAGVLAQCRSLCESIPDPALRGKLYSDIGLGYSQLHVFSLAAESFERALALCGGQQDRRREAALLQNLGAAHNALGAFGRALRWHRRAAALHGALGNRRAQGQCFGNLAYACSQLRDHEAAAENYLHALQAFRDVGDVQGQWQVCEGLGTAYFHLGNPQKAVEHYKEALTLLSHCQDTPRAAHERVVHKLTVTIQHQLCLHSRLSHGGRWGPVPARDPSQLQFCSTLPHASGMRRRGSEASLRVKAQPGDKPHPPVPGARPGCPEEWCRLTVLQRSSVPHAATCTPLGRRMAPVQVQGVAVSPSLSAPTCTQPRCLAAASSHVRSKYHQSFSPRQLRAAVLTLRFTGRRDCQTLRLQSPERPNDDPATSYQPQGSRKPRTGTRMLSLICSLV